MRTSAEHNIRTTLESYNPNGFGILIGTSAIHWAIASRGGNSNSLRLTDVDLLASPDELVTIYEELPKLFVQEARFISDDASRLKVTPSQQASNIGCLVLDVLSDSNSYEDALVVTPANKRIYAGDISLTGHVASYNGVNYLELPFVFWWKSFIGRGTDKETLLQAIRLLHEQDLFMSFEPRSLSIAIEKAEAGLQYHQTLSQ